MPDLHSRAEEFLRRPFPLGDRAPGNLTDSLIARFLAEVPFDDPELIDLLSLCIQNAIDQANSQTGEAQKFYRESVEVLQGIQAELIGGHG